MTNSYDVDHGLSQDAPGPLEPVELAPTQAPGIRVEIEPDPRGVSVGVWQGSHCIYSGAHPIPAAPGVSTVEDERLAFEAWAEDQGFVLDCDFFEVSGQYYDQDDTQLAYDIWRAARASVDAPAAGDARPADRDAAFEAVRKRLCALPHYSFLSDGYGAVRRVEDRSGKWIEFDAAHELFDPVCVDAAIDAALAAQVPHKGDAA